MQLIFAPNWFIGDDLIIDLFSAITCFLISYFAIKYYKISDKLNCNFFYLGMAFILTGVSFIFKTLTNFTIYYKVLETQRIGSLVFLVSTIKSSDILIVTGILAFRAFMLLGLYMLYSVAYKNTSRMNHILFVFFIIVTTYFSTSSYHVFHMAALILILAITAKQYEMYKINNNKNTKKLFTAFSVLAISHILFMFVAHSEAYVAAEIVQLIGYLILLIALIYTLKHGKKEKQD